MEGPISTDHDLNLKLGNFRVPSLKLLSIGLMHSQFKVFLGCTIPSFIPFDLFATLMLQVRVSI